MADFRLISTSGDHALAQGENVIGSFRHCQVVIEGEGVAGEHARVDVSGTKLTVTDLDSESGTFVNGERIERTEDLLVGAELRIGSIALKADTAPRQSIVLRSPTVRRYSRRAAKIGAGVLGVLLLGYLGIRIVYNAARIERDLVESIEEHLSRDAEVGSVDLSILAGVTEYRDVVIHNLPEFSGEPFMRVPLMRIGYSSGGYLSLFGQELRMEILLQRPAFLLERSDRGGWNVGDLSRSIARMIVEASADRPRETSYTGFELHVRIVDAVIRLRDDLAGRNDEIEGVSFTVDLDDLNEPLVYELTMDVPVAAHRGRVEARGEVKLFAGSTISPDTVNGKLLRLSVEELDVRAVPGLRELLAPLLEGRLTTRALDLEFAATAETLRKVTVSGEVKLPETRAARNGGGGERPKGDDVYVNFDVTADAVSRNIERGSFAVRGSSCSAEVQGRLIPAEEGADVLDLDATIKAPVRTIAAAMCGEVRGLPLEGETEFRISTTGSTRDLAVDVQMRADGLSCTETRASPEDATLTAKVVLGFDGWSSLDSAKVQSLTAEASFLHAALGPVELLNITRPDETSGRLGLLEVEFDVEELSRRYGPLVGVPLPGTKVHLWAEASGEEGRFSSRYSIQTANGTSLEGTGALHLAEAQAPRLQIDARVADPDVISAKIGADLALSWPEPGFDLSLSASGELSGLLETVRPYLSAVGSVWARGKFSLTDARVTGTPRRFSTKGKLELLEPELWGGLATALPFSEPRFDALWNVEFDLTKWPATLKANVLKGSSSLLQFRLEGLVGDIRRGLGRYDLQAYADLDRVGSVLKKLGIAGPDADIRGTVNLEMAADTSAGDIRISRLQVDTPFLEAEGGGEIHVLPLNLLLGMSPVAGAPSASGKLNLSAQLNVAEAMALAPELVPGYFRMGGPELKGSIKFDLTAQGAGQELVLDASIDLDDFVGRLGRYVRKTADELASLRLRAAVSGTGRELLSLQSGALILGGAANPAKLELSGSLLRDLSAFELGVNSKGFPIGPIAELGEDLAPGCSGRAAIGLKVKGAIKNAEVRAEDLDISGEIAFANTELVWLDLPELRTRLGGALVFEGTTLKGRDIEVEVLARGNMPLFPIPAGTVRFEEMTFDLSRGASPDGTFVAHTGELDMDVLVQALASAGASRRSSAPADAEGAPSDIELEGRISVKRAHAFGKRLEFADVGAEVGLSNGQLAIRKFGAKIWNGALSGHALVDVAGRGAIASGELRGEGIDLARVSKTMSIDGAFVGDFGGRLSWSGRGLTLPEFERNWSFDIEARTGTIRLAPQPFPLAREVDAALSSIMGATLPRGASTSKPVTVRLALRRGRLTTEAVAFEFENGLKLGMRGRTELDGRIAGWISVEELPKGEGAVKESLRARLEELARRGGLRIAVTGTWIQPEVDVKGLLWLLSNDRDEGAAPAEPPPGPEVP